MKKLILPVFAIFMAILAIYALVTSIHDNVSTARKGIVRYAEADAEGNIRFSLKELSEDNVSFIRIPGGSKIELLARKDREGAPGIALGTCQSCNGSPAACFQQEGKMLQCANCGQTFSLDVIGKSGGGCRPIALSNDVLEISDTEAVIHAEALDTLEALFMNVKAH